MNDTQNLRHNSLHNLLINNGFRLNEVKMEVLETPALLISIL